MPAPRASQPLQPTRVARRYLGGALLSTFHGGPRVDDLQPEDWVGSDTLAKDGGPSGLEGLSRLHDGTLLRDAIAADPEGWLGADHVAGLGPSTGVLVKLLDAAQRLPIHAHPAADFARAHLGNDHGKTEAWIVLEAREGGSGEAWIGLRQDTTAEAFGALVQAQDIEGLLGALNHVTLRPGDVVYVPGGVPHAMAGGLLIAELQEPTDFSLHLEWKGYPERPESVRHMGLGWDLALQSLVLDHYEVDVRDDLPPAAAEHFGFAREVTGEGTFAVVIVTGGTGTIDDHPARRGSTFVVPACAPAPVLSGELELLYCMPPRQGFL